MYFLIVLSKYCVHTIRKRSQNMGMFDQVSLLPPDPIFVLNTEYQNDPRGCKVDLGVGVYKNEKLLTEILPSVKKAEEHIISNEKTKTYLPIEGDAFFLDQVSQLVFGSAFFSANQARIASVQAIGGTGALQLAGTFLKKENFSKVYVSNPTWPNHRNIFVECGLQVFSYPFYDKSNHCIDFEQFISFFSFIEEKSILVLHACCHNPTGMDLTIAQCKVLLKVCQEKRLMPLFDCAYLGLGESLDSDSAMLRMFAREGVEMLVAFSCSKNFGLYAERVGVLWVLSESSFTRRSILSQLQKIARANYSNPPKHGAQIVAHILESKLKKEWELELASIRKRMCQMRNSLCSYLKRLSYLRKGLGMFGLSGLNPAQVKQLKEEYAVYMTEDGRMNLCGLNLGNVEYVAQALLDICEK